MIQVSLDAVHHSPYPAPSGRLCLIPRSQSFAKIDAKPHLLSYLFKRLYHLCSFSQQSGHGKGASFIFSPLHPASSARKWFWRTLSPVDWDGLPFNLFGKFPLIAGDCSFKGITTVTVEAHKFLPRLFSHQI